MEKTVSIFRFKKFSVVNERSAMKVNTDGVLLGAVMTIGLQDRRLLDIGTGTGTIALMAAQRLMDMAAASQAGTEGDIMIDAIDIDEPSVAEASVNFRNSPWSEVLRARHMSLDDFAVGCGDIYDLVFSNPPYFDSSLQAPQARRNAARHTSTGLSYREIMEFSAKRLSSEGRLALVLPADTEQDLTRHARMNGLYPYKITRIRTVPRKAPGRIVAEFSRQRLDCPEDSILTIQSEGRYTDEYLSLMSDFYLFA